MKNYADLGGCYPPQPSALADNTLLDLHNSSYHTQPHPIIAKYSLSLKRIIICFSIIAQVIISEQLHFLSFYLFFSLKTSRNHATAILKISASVL